MAMLRQVRVERFVVDGELVVEIDGHLAFDALQMRLHPAESRIRKLTAETPARLILFDMLAAPDGRTLRGTARIAVHSRGVDLRAKSGKPLGRFFLR